MVVEAVGSVLAHLAMRLSDALSAHIRRLADLDRVFKAESISAAKRKSTIAQAVEDIERVFGRNAALDTRMSNFLSELPQSGFFDHLCACAYLEIDHDGLRLLFESLVEKHFGTKIVTINGQNKSTTEFFLLFRDLLKVALEHLYGDLHSTMLKSDIANIKATLQRDVSARSARIFVINATNTRLNIPETQEKSAWFFAESKYLVNTVVDLKESMRSHFATISVEGPNDKTEECPITSLYVPTKVTDNIFATSKLLETKTDGTTITTVFPLTAEGQAFDPIFFKHARILLLGDPGSGKTTLVRRICYEIIDDRIRFSAILPLFVPLRRFYAEKRKDNQLTMIRFILSEICRQSNQDVEEVYPALRHCLEYGYAVVLFDGLDEVIDIASRREIVTEVTQFISLFSLCRCIVSSRIVGYEKAPIQGFTAFRVLPFDDEDITQYYTHSAVAIFGQTKATATRGSVQFLREAKRHSSEFISNPLLLSLIVHIFATIKRIPDDRLAIYDECSRLLFRRWDKLRKIDPDVPDEYRMFGLITNLAAKMYTDPQLAGGVTRTWLVGAGRDYFAAQLEAHAADRALQIAERFADYLPDRAWVLKEIETDRFEFTHRTFLEYFFALCLDEKYERISDLYAFVEERIKHGEWNTPLHLVFHKKTKDKVFRSSELSELLRKTYGGATEDEADDILEFIARSIGYLQPNEKDMLAIARIITTDASSSQRWRGCFVSILRSSNEMKRVAL